MNEIMKFLEGWWASPAAVTRYEYLLAIDLSALSSEIQHLVSMGYALSSIELSELVRESYCIYRELKALSDRTGDHHGI